VYYNRTDALNRLGRAVKMRVDMKVHYSKNARDTEKKPPERAFMLRIRIQIPSNKLISLNLFSYVIYPGYGSV
jgi:hypothetical protein